LNERGQFLPVEPPIPQRATAGGTVAAAASGPLRASYGTPRDYLLGASAIGADGKPVSAGGSVVKNVAGYDLCKLYTGSLGTLGILSRLTFKVLPRPRIWAYSGVATRDAAGAEALIARVEGSDVAPAALELVNAPVWQAVSGASLSPDRHLAFFVFAGEEETVTWQQSALDKIAGESDLRAYSLPELQAEVWFRALRDFPARPGLVLRLSVRSSDTAALAAALEELCAGWQFEVGIVAGPGEGVRWARHDDVDHDRLPDIVAALRAEATERGGHVVVQRVPEGFTGHLDRWGPPPPGFELMRGIKQSLDPAGLFSPGRFVGGI
jgi:glycolate oxidase FAD binding subunit